MRCNRFYLYKAGFIAQGAADPQQTSGHFSDLSSEADGHSETRWRTRAKDRCAMLWYEMALHCALKLYPDVTNDAKLHRIARVFERRKNI